MRWPAHLLAATLALTALPAAARAEVICTVRMGSDQGYLNFHITYTDDGKKRLEEPHWRRWPESAATRPPAALLATARERAEVAAWNYFAGWTEAAPGAAPKEGDASCISGGAVHPMDSIPIRAPAPASAEQRRQTAGGRP